LLGERKLRTHQENKTGGEQVSGKVHGYPAV
jgi:hypothetical protein